MCSIMSLIVLHIYLWLLSQSLSNAQMCPASFHPLLSIISNEQSASANCSTLNLESPACYHDCQYYNNVSTLLVLANSTTPEDRKLLKFMMDLYSVSAGHISYFDVGNVAQCEFVGGNYCFLPGFSGNMMLTQHACCIPGSCTGTDAYKVLSANNWCYKTYHDLMALAHNKVIPICEPMEREMDRAAPWITISCFLIFVLCILMASVLRRYYLEYTEVDTMVVDRNPFVSAFNIEGLWRTFVERRPKEHSSLNFLDGIRVWSMNWVILGHSFIFYFNPSFMASNWR